MHAPWGRCVRLTAFLAILACGASAQSIELDFYDAEAWLPEQNITGSVEGEIDAGVVHVNDDEYPFEVAEGRFIVDVVLRTGENIVVACSQGACSDTARWVIGYDLVPEIYAGAEVSGRTVTLSVDVLEAPYGPPESYQWSADPDNPAPLTVTGSGETAQTTIPDDAPFGEYFFDVVVADSAGKEGRARTFVTVSSEGIVPFDIEEDHAEWIERAIVYEVTPYIFEPNGRWRDVTERLDEIARLGVNTLWIQPVFEAQREGPGTSGQGYGITNYFRLRDDLGSEEDLRELVRSAKEDFGMRVLFDFVPSHTSIQHRYAQDVLAHREASRYYDFYMTEPDDAPYSQHYSQSDTAAYYPFFNYFWERLVIIDWNNPEVYRWMREAGQKWIEEYDIDGYRIDAVWSVNARAPEAMQNWRFDLKRIKPEIFLLGESPAARDLNFEGRFDAAYDWYDEYDWVSHWTWQTSYSEQTSHTVFNSSNATNRASLLRRALTNEGKGHHPNALVFRFMENNDTRRFIADHTVEQTKMAATLLFSLPGIPMIYNGQEIGSTKHPYSTNFIFARGRSIRSLDPLGLVPHYEYLTWLRSSVPALHSRTFEEVPVTPEEAQRRVFAFRRWSDGLHVIAAVNTIEEPVEAELHLPAAEMQLDADATYYLTDLMTGAVEMREGAELGTVIREIPGYTTLLLAISDDALQLPVATEPPAEVPALATLARNYPNPFDEFTTISFSIPEAAPVSLAVFDVLGRRVATLIDRTMSAGDHDVRFEPGGLASGVYFYRLEVGEQTLTGRMLLNR